MARLPSAPNSLPNNGTSGGPSGVVPPYMTNPVAQPESTGKGRPNQIAPQSRLDQGAYNLPSQAEVALRVRDAIARELGESGAAVEIASQPTSETTPRPETMTASGAAPELSLQPSLQSEAQTRQPTALAGAAMHSAVAVQLGDSTPHPALPPAEVTDVLPTARYVSNARAVQTVSSHPDIAAAQAAEIRRHQSDPGTARTGQGSPPAEDSIMATEENAQYTSPQLLAQNQSSTLVAQPSRPPTGQPLYIPDTGTQQYPQPRTAPASCWRAGPFNGRLVQRSTPRRRSQHACASSGTAPGPHCLTPAPRTAVKTLPSVPEPTPPAANLPAASTPSAGQPLGGQPYPLIGPPYPLAAYGELMARNVPPLGGFYEAQAPLPMTPRQEAESELESLEGSYSGWWGVTPIGRVRSGTSGLDRLTDVEAPGEVSTVLGRSVRLTAVARPVSSQLRRAQHLLLHRQQCSLPGHDARQQRKPAGPAVLQRGGRRSCS